ncbi:MAG TPA: hypothetical protein VKI65_12065, partial [Gemmataceae bacterium]|nr:hypothetical protein [Gemmataceae bacterium]
MDCQLICTWLSLSAWPPDHYTLLNLEPGEADRERIEQHAHERLLCLRRYQLMNPELATEAMNRLAQAVVCLTDPEAKKAYDATLAGEQPVVTDVAAPGYAAVEETVASAAAGPIDPLAWLFGPWNPGKAEPAASAPAPATIDWSTSPPPPRIPATPAADPIPADTIIVANGTAVDAPVAPTEGVPVPPVAAPPPPVDPVVEAARSSAPARRGLLTKRALYTRIARTRRLLRAWEEAGKYLRNPERRLARRAEATDLVHQLSTVRQLLRNFPPLLGEAGQPGYSVIALARQQLIGQTFQGLLPSQREVLARDWKDGHTLLKAHR